MKLTKSIIAEIKKHHNHKLMAYEMFYKVKYMDDTTKTYLLPSDDYDTAIEWYNEWTKNYKETIHKEVHCVFLRKTLQGTSSVIKYNVKKSVSDYADDYKQQVF